MKNSKEIAETVFQKRDAYLNRQRERNKKIKKAIPIGSTFCIFIIVMISANYFIDDSRFPSVAEPTSDSMSEYETVNSTENTENISEEDTSELFSSESVSNEIQDFSEDTRITVLETTVPAIIEPVRKETAASDVSAGELPKESKVTEQAVNSTELTEEVVIRESETTVIKPIIVTPDVPEEIVPTENEMITEPNSEETIPSETEMMPEPNWDEKTITQKFPEFSWNDDMYRLQNAGISPEYVGDEEADISLSGYDIYTDTQYFITAYLHKIANISEKCAVAVRFKNNDNYYIYINNDYRPATLGELIEKLDLENTISFNHVYLKDNFSTLSEQVNQSEVISFLTENRDCRCISDDFSYKKLITFGTNIKLLGVFSKFITISDNGYLITNILEWRYNFYIGEDKANQFCEMFGEIPETSDNTSSSFPEDDIVPE